MNNAKAMYRELCSSESTVPLFSQDWWLDATVGDANWDVVVHEKQGSILGALPYVKKRRYGFTVLGQPLLTQTLGPWVREVNGKYATKLSFQKDVMHALIDGLPAFDRYAQNWHHRQSNWIPFYWSGFSQTTRYTYVLPDITDEKNIWDGFQLNIRTDIRKARERFKLVVRSDATVDEFLELNRLVFLRQEMRCPYSDAYVKRLDMACAQRNARSILIAEDEKGRHHAGVYMVWDKNSAYYLMGGSDPELRSSGAGSLCMYEAIKLASQVTRAFDFEGSMLEPVERFVRGFGAVQTPYFSVHKTRSRLLHCLLSLKEMARSP